MELKYKAFSEKQKGYQEAIKILIEHESYVSAMQLLWTVTRDSIFHFLERKKKCFNSTQDAITIFILFQDSFERRKLIYEAYTSSIINEWDVDALINQKQFHSFKKSCLLIQKIATYE